MGPAGRPALSTASHGSGCFFQRLFCGFQLFALTRELGLARFDFFLELFDLGFIGHGVFSCVRGFIAV